MEEPKRQKLVPLNTRITEAHDEFVKSVAKRDGMSQGEVVRAMLDSFIRNYSGE